MSETAAPYRVAPLPAAPPVVIEPPLSPRLRALLIALRRALLIMADGLAAYCELPEKSIR